MNKELKKALCVLLLFEGELRALAQKSETAIDDAVVDTMISGATMILPAALVSEIRALDA